MIQLLLGNHKKAKGNWKWKIISSNSVAVERAGHTDLFSRCLASSITSLFSVSTFPHFHVTLSLGDNLKEAERHAFTSTLGVFLVSLFEDSVMQICSKLCPISWVRCFCKSIQLSPWGKSCFSWLESICHSVLLPTPVTKSKDETTAFTRAPFL